MNTTIGACAPVFALRNLTENETAKKPDWDLQVEHNLLLERPWLGSGLSVERSRSVIHRPKNGLGFILGRQWFMSSLGMIAGWLDAPPIDQTFSRILGSAVSEGDVFK